MVRLVVVIVILVALLLAAAPVTRAQAAPEANFQFEREGYFCLDEKDSSADNPVFNRTITLRDSWSS